MTGTMTVLLAVVIAIPLTIMTVGADDAMFYRLWRWQPPKMWQLEMMAVAVFLSAIIVVSGGGAIEWVGFSAILMAHGRSSINYRMIEAQQHTHRGDDAHVECARWSWVYLIGAEILWAVYFALHKSWAALAGVGVMLGYAQWRAWYSRRKQRGVR